MSIHDLITALLGGGMLGGSVAAVTAVTGRRVGVSGHAHALLFGRGPDRRFAAWFLAGMVAAGGVAAALAPAAFSDGSGRPLLAFLLGGMLIGWGARRASGCTSGHGIAGVADRSPRSVTAVTLFGLAAMAIVKLWPVRGDQ